MKPFLGNAEVLATLDQMIEQQRIPQTLLLGGPEGIGKATLARRFAARLLGGAEKIENDDLSLPHNISLIADREKWPSEKRNEDPLLFSTHPDFVTFAPDGPLRQLSIPQMRLLKERAQFKPLSGKYRVFLIDQIDRANEQAANSLLKTLEEPPEHLILIVTATNTYDLLPTIRSRAVPFHLTPLGDDEMRVFCEARGVTDAGRRIAIAAGSPGAAISLDLDAYVKRRTAMLALLAAASGRAPFSAWAKYSESVGQSKSEKLESYLKVLYLLLEDLVAVQHARSVIRNPEVRAQLEELAPALSFVWISAAVKKLDELNELLRRNIQKSIALDALVIELRALQA